tara:strand:+ start:258 stop:539 length:282 start_codon:yes stop_codon:yes gene_type:complete
MSDSNEEIKIDIVELNGKLDRITDNIETVKIKCDDIALCVNKVKKAVYDPDQGLYARLREIEQWKENTSKIIWVISTSIIGLATATVWHTFFK